LFSQRGGGDNTSELRSPPPTTGAEPAGQSAHSENVSQRLARLLIVLLDYVVAMDEGHGDVEELYNELKGPLERIVRRGR